MRSSSRGIHANPDATFRTTPYRIVAIIVFAVMALTTPARLHAQTSVGVGVASPEGTVSFSGSAQTTLPSSGLALPSGVAVDGKGDVFITDRNNARVVEEPWTGSGYGAQITLPASGLVFPSGVAVDATGDVFISDVGTNRVVELPWTGSGYGAQTTLPTSELSGPTDVAVDRAGDVFIAETENGPVVELPWTGSGFGAQITLPATGFENPNGVAVDAAGDVFITTNSGERVVELPWTGSGYGAQITLSASGLSAPDGVAGNAAGDVFIADSNNNRVVELQTASVNSGSANVCPAGQSTPAPCSQTVTLNYAVSDSTIGAVNVITQGTRNLDFTLSSTTCTGSQTADSTCTVTANFAPTAPGLRRGAVQLADNSGNVLASTPVYGTGLGPQVAYNHGTQNTLASGLDLPTAVAVDGAGDVFIADAGNNSVVEVPWTGNGYGAQTTLPASGLSLPEGVAVDGAGDVFITSPGSSSVVELPWTGSGYGTQTTLPASGLSLPEGVAVDGADDVFITSAGNERVVEVPWTGNGYGAQITLPTSGLDGPTAVAVDGAGDVFIVDADNNRVVELPWTGNGYGAQATLPASGLAEPEGVAVDGAGDVFITNERINSVVEVPWTGNGYGAQTTLSTSGLSLPYGVAVDGAGDVFITSPGSNRAVELQRSQPPALSFAATNVGQTSDSPQSFTIQNIGNQPLNAIAPGFSIGENFAQVAGSGTPEDCTSSFSLTPGASCNLSISFEPTAVGSIQSSAVLTDNALNGNPAMQTITLTGTGELATPTLTFAALSTQTYGAAPFAVSASSDSAGVITYSVVSGPATISGSTITITGAGTVTIQASQAATTDYAAATATTSFTVSQALMTVTANSASRQYNTANPAFTFSVTGFVNGDSSSVVSGTAVLSTTATTTSAPGSYPISFSTEGLAAANYTFNYLPGTLTVVQTSQTITFAALPNVTYGAAPIALTATASSGQPVTYTVTGPATLSGSMLTVTGVGTVTVTASVAAGTDFTAATPVTQTLTVNPATPTLTFASIANQTFGAAPFAVSATSNSTATITYSVVSGPATITGKIVTLTGDGTVTLEASVAAAGNYSAATATTTFSVTGTPAITVNNGNKTLNFGIFPFGLTGTNQITFAVTTQNNTANTTTISAALTNAPSNYTIISNGCSSPQSGWGSYCQITVGFTQPTTLAGLAQTYTANLVLTSSNPSFGFVAGEGTLTITAGSAKVYTNAPYGTTAANPYNFGSASNGGTGGSLSFQIFNPSGWNGSGAPASVSLSNYDNWNFTGNCDGYLADNSSCTGTLQFKGSYPSGQTNTGVLTIGGNSSGVQVWNSNGSAVYGRLYLTGQTN
jgi:hypothetical protein